MIVSGLYVASGAGSSPFAREELRLDVDGDFPQMALSGTAYSGLNVRVDWLARPLAAVAGGLAGAIVRKSGSAALLPYTQVKLGVAAGKLKLNYSGAGMPDKVRRYKFKRRAFREVAFEFDSEQGVAPVLDYGTHQHPDRPATLPNETLSIAKVYARAGFKVTNTGGNGTVPSAGAGADAAWSDAEMHDAMQVNFSAFRNQAQWDLWTFFAGLHEQGNSLGGIMFDQIGPQQRQGTALFLRSFISAAPAGDPAPAAWRRRMAFWTAVHEMGHGFNLLHAWQKQLGQPWQPLASGYDQLSFMNYPYFYPAGPGAGGNANTVQFFRNFRFRFTDEELLFLRHAPEQSVIMGGEVFGQDHGFEQAQVAAKPPLGLELRANRAGSEFEFLEPVVLELKLTNLRPKPVKLPDALLRMTDGMTVLVQRRGGPRRAWHPYAHYCRKPEPVALAPGKSLYESLFVSSGAGRWLIDEPGYYTVQVCLHLHGEDVVSNAYTLRVAPPHGRAEEYIAQDWFSDGVGRVLNFDGSLQLAAANDTLRALAQQLAGRKAALHAEVALAMPRLRHYKLLNAARAVGPKRRYRLRRTKPDAKAAKALSALLTGGADRADAAAAALGHIDYREYALRCSAALATEGDAAGARSLRGRLVEALRKRKVLNSVLTQIRRIT